MSTHTSTHAHTQPCYSPGRTASDGEASVLHEEHKHQGVEGLRDDLIPGKGCRGAEEAGREDAHGAHDQQEDEEPEREGDHEGIQAHSHGEGGWYRRRDIVGGWVGGWGHKGHSVCVWGGAPQGNTTGRGGGGAQFNAISCISVRSGSMTYAVREIMTTCAWDHDYVCMRS